MNPNFVEMLRALSDAGADFLIVGAHARAAYGEPRATKDLDIWVRPTPENAARVWNALVAFGAPTFDLTRDDLAQPGLILQLGVPPYRIGIITELTALHSTRHGRIEPRLISAERFTLSSENASTC